MQRKESFSNRIYVLSGKRSKGMMPFSGLCGSFCQFHTAFENKFLLLVIIAFCQLFSLKANNELWLRTKKKREFHDEGKSDVTRNKIGWQAFIPLIMWKREGHWRSSMQNERLLFLPLRDEYLMNISHFGSHRDICVKNFEIALKVYLFEISG